METEGKIALDLSAFTYDLFDSQTWSGLGCEFVQTIFISTLCFHKSKIFKCISLPILFHAAALSTKHKTRLHPKGVQDKNIDIVTKIALTIVTLRLALKQGHFFIGSGASFFILKFFDLSSLLALLKGKKYLKAPCVPPSSPQTLPESNSSPLLIPFQSFQPAETSRFFEKSVQTSPLETVVILKPEVRASGPPMFHFGSEPLDGFKCSDLTRSQNLSSPSLLEPFHSKLADQNHTHSFESQVRDFSEMDEKKGHVAQSSFEKKGLNFEATQHTLPLTSKRVAQPTLFQPISGCDAQLSKLEEARRRASQISPIQGPSSAVPAQSQKLHPQRASQDSFFQPQSNFLSSTTNIEVQGQRNSQTSYFRPRPGFAPPTRSNNLQNSQIFERSVLYPSDSSFTTRGTLRQPHSDPPRSTSLNRPFLGGRFSFNSRD